MNIASHAAPATSWRYALWAGLCALASACAFYTDMLRGTVGEWSAPLDDVFIHFDFARSMARGFAGQWVPGNGYSSGATSMLYPAVLAPGYGLGFRGPSLMAWAAWVACVCVFYTFINLERALSLWAYSTPRATFARQALLPLALLMVGAVVWSLWSGMEIALFMALWSRALLAWVGVARGGSPTLLSVLCVLCVMTRPEAATTVALFALSAHGSGHAVNFGQAAGPVPAAGGQPAQRVLQIARIAGPAALTLLLQAGLNRILTGETSAYGALVKLAAYSPQMTLAQKVADYKFNLEYAFRRPFEHHLSDSLWASSALLAVAGVGLVWGTHAKLARQLALHIVAWCALVALNGQVRWQNERYLVPAMMMTLVVAVLGAAQLIALRVGRERPWRRGWLARELSVGLLLAFIGVHQVSKWQEQKWFFAKASQNIRDQQTALGRWLHVVGRIPTTVGLKPGAHRVLLSDAGAIPYASAWPALDIMGLGGYHDLPFARASGHELPAVLELIENMPPHDRPDVLAIFPSWWPTLPVWFSSGVIKRFPLSHNVICGDFEHVAYKADWSLLNTGDHPFSRPSGATELVDTLDIADLQSERAHRYVLASPTSGKTLMHVMPDPTQPERDVWDAGRSSPDGLPATFALRGARPGTAVAVVRLAVGARVQLLLRCGQSDANGAPTWVGQSDTWVEVAWKLQLGSDSNAQCQLSSEGSSHEAFHVFLFQ